jgi:hypothetical protein
MQTETKSRTSQVTRLNRVQADEIAQTLDTLSVIALDHPDTVDSDSQTYAQAFTSAADAIRILSKQKALTPEVNEAYQATGYLLDLDEENHRLRLALYQGDPKNVRSFLLLDSPEVYDTAQRLIRKYDILEGIK